MSGLPEALREDFEKLDQLEGQYRVTTIRMEVVDGKGPLCPFCFVKEEAEEMKKMVEQYKPMTTLSKVIQVTLLWHCDIFLSIVEGGGGVGDVQGWDQVDRVHGALWN